MLTCEVPERPSRECLEEMRALDHEQRKFIHNEITSNLDRHSENLVLKISAMMQEQEKRFIASLTDIRLQMRDIEQKIVKAEEERRLLFKYKDEHDTRIRVNREEMADRMTQIHDDLISKVNELSNFISELKSSESKSTAIQTIWVPAICSIVAAAMAMIGAHLIG